MTTRVITLVAVCWIGLACHDASTDVDAECRERPVRMGVASSLREIALGLGRELSTRPRPIKVESIFGASSVLARQLALGAPLDLLVSADADIVDDLLERGLLTRGSAIEIARGQLALVARADWEPQGPGVLAFASDDLERVALPSIAVPLGRYARSWLEGHSALESLSGRVVTTEHARATLSAVDAGLVDLAIVYASDARLAQGARIIGHIDPSEYPPIRYVAARSAHGPPCPTIADVLNAWSSPETTRRLAAHGFLLPSRRERLP